MWLDYVDGEKLNDAGTMIVEWGSRKKKRKVDFKEQASRTAWRLIQDWVEVQLSMVQMKQADFVQVFLPYVWDGKRNQTFYAALKECGYKGLLPERTE